jgi:hypothetical protein
MTFKPAIWHPIAVVLTVINLVGAGMAIGTPDSVPLSVPSSNLIMSWVRIPEGRDLVLVDSPHCPFR